MADIDPKALERLKQTATTHCPTLVAYFSGALHHGMKGNVPLDFAQDVAPHLPALLAAYEQQRAESTRLRSELESAREIARAESAEAESLRALVERQSDLLTGVANALRGPSDGLHSHHDLPERAAALVAEAERLRKVVEAAKERVAHGHNDTCSGQVYLRDEDCSCGHDDLFARLQELGEAVP